MSLETKPRGKTNPTKEDGSPLLSLPAPARPPRVEEWDCWGRSGTVGGQAWAARGQAAAAKVAVVGFLP
jgi:hypothetical protein